MPVQSPVGSRAPFPKPPKWTVAVLVVLCLGVVGHFFVGLAQLSEDDVDNLFGCVRNEAGLERMEQETADDSPNRTGGPIRDTFEIVLADDLVNEVFMCSLAFGEDFIVPYAWDIFIPLALIMTVWFGVTVMFGGGNPSEVLGFLMRMGLAVMLLNNYFHDTPETTPLGESQGVVWTVARQGIILGRTLVEDARDFADTAYNDAREATVRREVARIVSNIMDPDGEYTVEEVSELAAAARRGVEQRAEEQVENWMLGVVERGWRYTLWIIKWFVYAQYLWAFVGLSVLGILGPLFIPWMIVPQLDWLFWSWFRGLLQVTIHMMTSAVMYVVASLILSVPMAQIASFRYDADPETMGDMVVFIFNLIVPYTPIILVVAAAALKAGAFASGLMSGSGMTGGGLVGGSGLGGGMFSAATLAVNPAERKAAMRAARQNVGAGAHLLTEGYRAGRAGKLSGIIPLSRSAPGWSDAQDVYRDYAYRRDRLERIRGDRAERGRGERSSMPDDQPPAGSRPATRSEPYGSAYDGWNDPNPKPVDPNQKEAKPSASGTGQRIWPAEGRKPPSTGSRPGPSWTTEYKDWE